MANSLPRVCVFTSIQGLFHGVKKGLPSTEVLNIPVPAGSDPLSSEERAKISDAEILLSDPGHLCKHDLIYLPKLKWMQSTWAGVDPLMRALDKTKPYPTYQLVRAAGNLFGPHMAEYILSHIISQERQFPEMAKDQRNKQWIQKKYSEYRLLSQLTLGILGLGDIGRDIAKAAKCFGMTVWGLGSRDGTPRHACPHVDEYRGPSGLQELLAASDYICSVLPSTEATKGLLSGYVLACCSKKRPVFINIGRGDVISEETIIKALSEGWISKAVLDVFEKEPLPDTSPLWDHPSVTITPHASGFSQAWQIQELFIENYKRYVDGKPLENVLAWEAGY